MAYTNPSARRGNPAQAAILAALRAHPDTAEFQRLVGLANGVRAASYVRHHVETRGWVDVRHGRSRMRLLDNPATLTAHAEAVAHCPGWTGKRTPRPVLRDSNPGEIYTHAQGWTLFVPFWRHHANRHGQGKAKTWPLRIGHVTLDMDPRDMSIHGQVPAAWLVDLNAGANVDENLQPVAQLELLAA